MWTWNDYEAKGSALLSLFSIIWNIFTINFSTRWSTRASQGMEDPEVILILIDGSPMVSTDEIGNEFYMPLKTPCFFSLFDEFERMFPLTFVETYILFALCLSIFSSLVLSRGRKRSRPPCTTMPWTIWPALMVLWGVCWMFYTPLNSADKQRFELSLLETNTAWDLFSGSGMYSSALYMPSSSLIFLLQKFLLNQPQHLSRQVMASRTVQHGMTSLLSLPLLSGQTTLNSRNSRPREKLKVVMTLFSNIWLHLAPLIEKFPQQTSLQQ